MNTHRITQNYYLKKDIILGYMGLQSHVLLKKK